MTKRTKAETGDRLGLGVSRGYRSAFQLVLRKYQIPYDEQYLWD